MSESVNGPVAAGPRLIGQTDFEIVVPDSAKDSWHAANGRVAVGVMPSKRNDAPSKRLGEIPALIWKENRIHWTMGQAKPGLPQSWREQILVCELNGVFVHVVDKGGQTNIIVADRKLK